MTRGLVFGKFYPPHRGHTYLIDSAAAQCDELTVLVMDNPDESIPGSLRAAWLAEIHPRARVLYAPHNGSKTHWPEDDTASWLAFAAHVRQYHPEQIDRLFTSEWYGPTTARYLGASHIAVDPDRQTVPVSGTLVRSAPLDHLDALEPCVRGYYVRVVAVVGAESTGKTTLSEALAARLATMYVPEFGREFSLAAGATATQQIEWRGAHFETIARTQTERIAAAARTANRIVISDTDAFATEVWHERYLGALPAFGHPRAHLYLFTQPDIPFVQDGIRDGEHVRLAMSARIEERLLAERLTFVRIGGSIAERLDAAAAAIVTLTQSS